MRDYSLRINVQDERDYKYTAPLVSVLPSAADIRYLCPPVYDQGQEGSCTANAGCAARIMLSGNTSLDLSRAFLYYEERYLENSTDRDSGATIRDTCRALKIYGVSEESYMKYDDKVYSVAPTQEAMQNAIKYKINSYQKLLSIVDVKKAIAIEKKPVLIGMIVYESMETKAVAATGKLLMPKFYEKQLGGHAVLIVGYKDNSSIFAWKSTGYFIVRNSWGTKWGDKGYFYMPYEYFNKYTSDYWIIQ